MELPPNQAAGQGTAREDESHGNPAWTDPARDGLVRDDLVPIPPRFWWLKRIGIGVAALLVALVILRLWWGWEAQRRWAAVVARYEALGEPLHAADFMILELPDPENAAFFLRRAGQLAARLQPPVTARNDLVDNIRTAEGRTAAAAALVALRPALDDARFARGLAHANWGPNYKNGFGRPVPLSGQCELADALLLAAVEAQERGDSAVAVEFVRDMLHQERMLRQEHTLLAALMSDVVCERAARTVGLVSAGLMVAGPSEVSGRAQRRDVEELVRSLLDEEEIFSSIRWGMLAERGEHYALLVPSPSAVFRWAGLPRFADAEVLLGPAWLLDAPNILAFADAHIAMAEAREKPQAQACMRGIQEPANRLDRACRSLSRFVVYNLGGVVLKHFETLAQRRLAAVRLALRLYELDHGRVPESLVQLVPTYLSRVPDDPVLGGGRSIGYESEGPEAGLFAGTRLAPASSAAPARPARSLRLWVSHYPISVRLVPQWPAATGALKSAPATEPIDATHMDGDASTQAVEHEHDVER